MSVPQRCKERLSISVYCHCVFLFFSCCQNFLLHEAFFRLREFFSTRNIFPIFQEFFPTMRVFSWCENLSGNFSPIRKIFYCYKFFFFIKTIFSCCMNFPAKRIFSDSENFVLLREFFFSSVSSANFLIVNHAKHKAFYTDSRLCSVLQTRS